MKINLHKLAHALIFASVLFGYLDYAIYGALKDVGYFLLLIASWYPALLVPRKHLVRMLPLLLASLAISSGQCESIWYENRKIVVSISIQATVNIMTV